LWHGEIKAEQCYLESGNGRERILMAQLKTGTTIGGRDVMLEIDNLDEEVIEHKNETVQQSGGAHGLDIEAGVWTPRFALGNHTHSTQEGKYVRIGKLVFVSGNLQLSAKDEEATGNLVISGLPFAPNFSSAVAIGNFNHLSFGTAPAGVLYGATAGSDIALYYAADNGWGGNMQVDKLTYRTSMRFSAVYSIN
jgi:hypothetical protein